MQLAETNTKATLALPRREKVLRAFALLLFLAWGWMLLSALGTTLHSVDNVRDFRVALGIATGEAFPTVSQPFAASKQLPPLFFYTIALPLVLWPTEFAVFAFTAVAVLLSVGFLALAVQRCFGALATITYLALALPPHGAVVFQGVSNPALAFVCINVLLASYLWSQSARTALLMGVVLAAWAAPQMHPSAFFIAAFVFVASLIAGGRAWLRPAPAILLSLLALVTLLWVMRYGLVAPEAQSLGPSGNSSPITAAALRVLSVEHWGALWSTPWVHLQAIAGLPQWISSAAKIASWVVFASAIFGMWQLVRRGDRALRALAIALFANLICVTASLESWGFWYLDASWPMIALCAAIGSARAFRAIWAQRVLWPLTVVALALPCALFLVTKARGEYAIAAHGLFLPSPLREETLPVPTARTLIDLRAIVGERAGCDPARVVGIDEAFLRDMTLRTLFLDGCHVRPAVLAQSTTDGERILIRRIESTLPIPGEAEALIASVGPYRVYSLRREAVSVHGRESGALWGSAQGARYGFFAVLGLPKAAIIESRANAGASLYVGFRCSALNTQTLLAQIDSASKVEVMGERSLPPFTYTELRLTNATDQTDVLRLTARSDLPCDASAWVM
jgi:hypothetical protein